MGDFNTNFKAPSLITLQSGSSTGNFFKKKDDADIYVKWLSDADKKALESENLNRLEPEVEDQIEYDAIIKLLLAKRQTFIQQAEAQISLYALPDNEPSFNVPSIDASPDSPLVEPPDAPSFEGPPDAPSFEGPPDAPSFEGPPDAPSFEGPPDAPSFESPSLVLPDTPPSTIVELLMSGTITPKAAITVFSENEVVIDACYKMDADVIRYASSTVISELVTKGTINPQDAITVFPVNKDIAFAAYQKDPAVMQSLTISIMVELINEGKIKGMDALQIFPNNKKIVTASYQQDNDLIRSISPTIISTLVLDGTIPPKYAIIAFPDSEEIIKAAANKSKIQFFSLQKELIGLIQDGTLSPAVAVQNHPNNIGIISAAYKKDPASIKYADKETINTLGAAQVVRVEDVLSAFSRTLPSESEKQQTINEIETAVQQGNMEKLAHLSDKFWFERPPETNREDWIKKISQREDWGALYQFEKTCKIEYRLTAGPLDKSPETYQLEELAKKMILDGNFYVETIDGDDHFVFDDGTQFNWSMIREKADWQHIEFNQADFDLYNIFSASEANVPSARSSLTETEENYRIKLYEGVEVPERQMNLAEMNAINIYTGGFYGNMNGLMRGDIKKFDYKAEENIPTTRAALVHAVMCASGLRTVPMKEINTSYRGETYITDVMQKQRVEAAAKKGVIKLDGFVSTVSNIDDAFSARVLWTFNNLRGVNVACLAQAPDEREFLIPPTAVRITNFNVNNEKYEFTAELVSELGMTREIDPMFVEERVSGLSLATPDTVISLINKGEIDPNQAVKAFPDNKDVVLASFRKAPVSLVYASVTLLNDLEKTLSKPPEKTAKEVSNEALKEPNKNMILNAKLIKIQNSYNCSNEPDENVIRSLCKSVCQTVNKMGSPEFSQNTVNAKYLINKIKDSKELLQAFGLDSSKTEKEIVFAIRGLMKNAIEDKPLFTPTETSTPRSNL